MGIRWVPEGLEAAPGAREAGQGAAGAGVGDGDWGLSGKKSHWRKPVPRPCFDGENVSGVVTSWAFYFLLGSLTQGQEGHSRWMDLPKQSLGVKKNRGGGTRGPGWLQGRGPE